MAFNVNEMALMTYSGAGEGAHRLFFYTNSESDDVTAANFFDDGVDLLSLHEGDVIYDVDGAMHYTVSDITEGAVTVAALYDAPA